MQDDLKRYRDETGRLLIKNGKLKAEIKRLKVARDAWKKLAQESVDEAMREKNKSEGVNFQERKN